MNLIKDHKLHIPNEVGAFVQHTTQDFRSHDETRGLWIDLYISGENAHLSRREGLLEIAELLIGERFDWRCINCSCRARKS
jgi:hypothetical protein